MPSRMTSRIARHPLIGLGAESAVVIAAYLTYSALRVVVEGTQTQAIENAFHIVSIEQTFGMFHEAAILHAVEGQPWLAAIVQWFYLWAYLPILGIGAVIVFLRDRRLYRSYRNTMFIAALIGLIIFALLPVAPPRMLPEYGFLDPMHTTLTQTSAAKNDFAAVPSFHFGFTLLAALGIAHTYRFQCWLCVGLTAVPAAMLFAIVATANHFFLDAVIGTAVVMGVWWFVVWRANDEAEAESVGPLPATGVA